jgi:hypothetical protein
MNRFGWDKSQVDKLLKPVIRALEERGQQAGQAREVFQEPQGEAA